MAQRKPAIAIIGAGIAGLTAAATLRKAGFEADIYEQAPAFARIGAGIQLNPNGMKLLRGLGLEERIRRVGFAPEVGYNREWDTGNVTYLHPMGARIEERFGAPDISLHRAALHAALLSLIPPSIIHLDKKLVGLDRVAAGLALTFADGTRAVADAVIGADGVHSLVRDYVAGPQPPRFIGRLAYRTTFSTALLRGVEVGSSRTKWWGKDRHIVIYFVTAAHDEVYFTTSQPEKADWITKESWSAKGNLGEMQEAFASFHPDVQAVLSAAPDVHKWGIFERDPLPTWSKGRVVLLGDACHPMTPYMASGAAMALEDAAVLARCLDEIRDVEEAFRVYEATRKPRASMVQAGSSANTWMRTQTNPDWLYGYDAWTAPLMVPVAV